MKVKTYSYSYSQQMVRRFGAARLLILLAITIILWPQNAAGQPPVVPKLTLSQVEQLVSHGVPDSTLSSQIQRRGLAFTPNPALVDSLRAKGAGPQTLAAIQACFPNGGPSETGKHGTPARNGAESGGTDTLQATGESSSMLNQAKSLIPAILTRIYQSLDEGNPQGVHQFLADAIANDAQRLDWICHPFTYRAHYIEAIIERPGLMFEVRAHVLVKPLDEKVEVLTFHPNQGRLSLVQISDATDDWIGPEKEAAIQTVRNFIYAAKAQRADVLAALVGSGLDASQYTANACWRQALVRVTEVGSASAGLESLKGLKIKVSASLSIETRVFTGVEAFFWVDRINDQYRIVAAQPMRNPSFILTPAILFNDSPEACRHVGEKFFTPVEGTELENETLERFGLPQASLSPAVKAAPNRVEKAAPLLSDTMQFIQDKLKERGRMNFTVYTHDNANGKDYIDQLSSEASNIVADPAACTISFHSNRKRNGAVATDSDVSISLRDVRDVVVMPEEQDMKQRYAASGRPTWNPKDDQQMFLVVLRRDGNQASGFLFADEEMAIRVAKAVRRAIELCGGG